MVSQRSGWRRRTHCHIEGHGTYCVAVWESGNDGRYARATERRMVLRYEERAG